MRADLYVRDLPGIADLDYTLLKNKTSGHEKIKDNYTVGLSLNLGTS